MPQTGTDLPEMLACTICCITKRLRLSCSADGVVLSLKALEHRNRCSLRRTAMKDRVRRVFNRKLDFLSNRISSQKRHQHERRIQPGRYASSVDDVAVRHHPCIGEDCTIARQQRLRSPMCCLCRPLRTPAAPHSRAPVQTENKSLSDCTCLRMSASTSSSRMSACCP